MGTSKSFEMYETNPNEESEIICMSFLGQNDYYFFNLVWIVHQIDNLRRTTYYHKENHYNHNIYMYMSDFEIIGTGAILTRYI